MQLQKWGYYSNQNIKQILLLKISISNKLNSWSLFSGIKDLIFLGSSCVYPKIANNQ